jgi:hypothetical protein
MRRRVGPSGISKRGKNCQARRCAPRNDSWGGDSTQTENALALDAAARAGGMGSGAHLDG